MNKGDYRYNYRESAKGRRKPDEEVVYVKNVFPPLVPPDQWDRCNQIMDYNAKLRCSSGFPHKGTHIHIFAGLLKCGKCGSYFQVEKRDRVRRNGFAPSLYRCGRRYRKQHCISKSCSEVVVGPFVLNYISAMIRASDMRSQIHSPEELEKILLSDNVFQNVAGIVSDGLNATYAMLSGTDSSVPYRPLPLASHNVQEDDNVQKWEQGIVRIDRAIERLKKVYLFDDTAMSEKEYLETKNELERERIELDNKIKEQESTAFPVQTEDLAFIKSASSFLLAHRLKAVQDYIALYGADEEQTAILEKYTSTKCRQLCAIVTASKGFVRSEAGSDVSEERVSIVAAACSLIGKVGYFWGGKSYAIGWDDSWGSPMTVSAEGSKSSGTVRSYGLDCSGFVAWSYYNGLGGKDAGIGNHTTTQWNASEMVDSQSARPCDLVFYHPASAGDDNHVGIVVGVNDNGSLLVVHCSSSQNGVMTGEAWSAGFQYVRSPLGLE